MIRSVLGVGTVLLAVVFVIHALKDTQRGSRRREYSVACNCHGKSTRCFFDRELYERTGHGGHCLDCADNTEGPNCERCKAFYYRGRDNECVPCACDHVGSREQQCNEQGQCPCKPGVGGRRCEKCAPNYYDMSIRGCRSCGCHQAGVDPEADTCDPVLGVCPCKHNVEGNRCDRCKKGHFDLQEDNEFGCVPCFCYGHSDICTSASGHFKKIIESTFNENEEGWTAEDHRVISYPVVYDADLQLIEVRTEGRNALYFIAPECYLGSQIASYNQYLTFTLRIGAEGARVSVQDVILEGSGLKVSVPITSQGNPLPSHRIQNYKFRLHEHPRFDWTPRVSAFDFMKILSNLTALKIKATYAPEGVGYLDNVVMESAFQTPGNYVASWVESCSCPEGHIGLSCERCAPGYKRLGGGESPLLRCVRCNCHGHADQCDPDTGRCLCQHNTVGDQCERCATGYFGDPRRGTPTDCRPCICPNQSPCVMLPGGQMACQECPLGYTGHQCDLCIDGYYGDPLGRYGPPRPCRKCDCNDNVDLNAVGNCNTTSGECLKCIFNTAGRHCEKCRQGYYGEALALPRGNCRRCTCHLPGTVQRDRTSGVNPCDPVGGQCQCLPNVIGRRCERCRDGYWNLESGRGCEPCGCNKIASVNQTCDARTGQCHCQRGATGRHCDRCMPYHYGFSEDGCTACDCDPSGSLSLQCDTRGQCQCRPNREGRRCHVCKDHKYSRGTVCIDCPPCYNLLADAIEGFQEKLEQLARLMDDIANHPVPVEDLDFRRKLREVLRKVDDLVDDARRAAIADGSLIGQLNDLRKRIRQIQDTAGKMTEKLEEGRGISIEGVRNISMAEDTIQRILDTLATAREYMDNQGQKAWQAARDRSDRLGQQSERMSQIAREARLLADEQEDDAEIVEAVSDEALNVSSEAYRLAREATDYQDSMSGEVFELGKKVDDMADFMERTEKLAEDANKEAGMAYDDSLDIYTDAKSVTIPSIDVDGMKREAARITDEARRVNGEVKAMADDHNDTLNKALGDLHNAQALLGEAVRQQQITDELLADTDAALDKAHDAIASGEQVLNDSKATLDTLRGFDKEVKNSKARADNALKKIPELRGKIEEAEEKTHNAEDALGNAIQDATDARDIAQEAQKVAEQASKDADSIRDDADKTREHAGELLDLAEDLATRIDDTDSRMKGFENQAANDGELAKEALERANEAKNGALDASKNARDALSTLDDILDALSDLDDVDASQLSDLEKRLAIAEREMRLADLDARGAGLREARAEQQQWMRDYKDEIEQLKLEVANVAAIRNSLPEDCYRRLKLEP